jgi:hypothetical protein
MKALDQRRVLLVLASALLLGAILFGFGFLFAARRLNHLEHDALHEGILTQHSTMSRVAFAASQFLAYPPYDESLSGWIDGKSEQCRLLLSHASIPPATPQDSLRPFLGDDPLLVGPRMNETDSAFRAYVDELGGTYEDLLAAETDSAKSELIARFDARIPDFLDALFDRSLILEQFDATARAQLRANQQRVQRQLGFLLVGQIVGLLAASLVAYFVIRLQFWQVKVLKGLIPICASCKNVRDDAGFWRQVEAYIGARTDADFSHAICPECMEKLYPEMVD